MKNIKYFILLITIALIGFSCEDNGGTSVRVFETGIVPDMQKDASTDAFLDLVKINNGENISISFSAAVAKGEPTSIDIMGVYRAASGGVYNAVLFNNVSLPADFSLSVNDIVANFDEITDASDIQLGDIVSISARFTREDGRVLDIINADGTSNVNSNITNSGLFTSVINYPVSCPSDIGGTYTVVNTGTGCCGVSPITDYEFTVTVTDNGGGSYSLSELSGGAYDGLFCGAFGICGSLSPGDITDVCGTLSGSSADCCGSTIEFSGIVNPDGTWTVEVTSGFIAATSIWTKQ
ncbi:MAG: hypothetical protein AB3N18_04385 [Allomuricauda sp.]